MNCRDFQITAEGIATKKQYTFTHRGIGCHAALCEFLKGRTFHSLVVFVVERLSECGEHVEDRRVYGQK